MKKPLANLLTIWIPISSLRRTTRYNLIEFHPIKELLKRPRIHKYLDQKKKNGKAKVVVYTAISGGFDDLRTHKFLTDEFDYVCFTDQPVKSLHAWEIRPMKEYTNCNPVRKAKYYKMFPDKLFPEYEYSVWVDGKYEIVGPDFEQRIKEKISNDTLLSCVSHPDRDCIYKEAELCIKLKKDDPDIIKKQVEFLKNENYPENNGLFDMCFIFRKHNNSRVKEIMKDWWSIVEEYSRRDQLSFCYALWKNDYKVDHLFSPSDSPVAGNNKDYIFHFHKG